MLSAGVCIEKNWKVKHLLNGKRRRKNLEAQLIFSVGQIFIFNGLTESNYIFSLLVYNEFHLLTLVITDANEVL